MKEKIDSSDIPTSYLLCMKQDCPKATTCLRRIAEQQIGDEVKLWHVISPKYQEKQTDRCAYFRPADKLTYALGFIGMLDRMPYKLMQEAICKLMRRFGRRTYYRVRKGERPLSPDEQKSMLNILKQCGINDPGKVRCLLRGIRLVSSHDATCLRIGCAYLCNDRFLGMKRLCQAYVTGVSYSGNSCAKPM